MNSRNQIRRLPLFVMLLATLGLLLPATAFAQQRGHKGGEGVDGHFANPGQLMRMADELDLRDEQRDEIRTLLEANREQVQPLREQLREQTRSLREMMADSSASQTQVLAQLDQVLELEGQVKRRRAVLFLEVRDVLDEEQQERARELLEERRGERGDRRQKQMRRRGTQ